VRRSVIAFRSVVGVSSSPAKWIHWGAPHFGSGHREEGPGVVGLDGAQRMKSRALDWTESAHRRERAQELVDR
jgi:hypothetical protein